MTSRNEIAEWFEEGVIQDATHMLVVWDTFDNSDYPVYVTREELVTEVVQRYQAKPMDRINEVYVLDPARCLEQLAETMPWHLEPPKRPYAIATVQTATEPVRRPVPRKSRVMIG